MAVTARHLGGTGIMLAFDCSIRAATTDDQPEAEMVSGILTVYLLDSFGVLVEDFASND